VLRAGDIIVSVDGHLITTAEGGRRLARPEPGEAVELVVRREGRVMQLRLSPETVCADRARTTAMPTVVASPAGAIVARGGRGGARATTTVTTGAGRPTVQARGGRGAAQVASGSSTVASSTPQAGRGGGRGGASGAVAAQEALPGAWFGFGISCTSCGWERPSPAEPVRWSFEQPPQILSVEAGSPAARAGLRRGDVLTHIDGVALTTPEGGRRFGAVRPGETVRLTYTRDGTTNTVEIAAERRPSPSAALAELRREITAGRDSLSRLYELRERTATAQRARDATATYERDLIERLRSSAARAAAPEGRTEVLRYAGSVGDTDVEVRGNGSVITTILEHGRDIIIVTGDAQIRVRVRDARR
jgi:membrane-associated protease RseP (regulator of RpoE activity)